MSFISLELSDLLKNIIRQNLVYVYKIVALKFGIDIFIATEAERSEARSHFFLWHIWCFLMPAISVTNSRRHMVQKRKIPIFGHRIHFWGDPTRPGPTRPDPTRPDPARPDRNAFQRLITRKLRILQKKFISSKMFIDVWNLVYQILVRIHWMVFELKCIL